MSQIKLCLSVMIIGILLLGTEGWSTGLPGQHSGQKFNEFDMSRHNVPLHQILSGGPPKDGIPAILKPVFVSASDAGFLSEQDRVLGMVEGDDAKAYPIKILNWHEIVNDTIGGKPVVVTYCPLCGTGIGFHAVVKDQTLTFGVSGLLYQSDMIMYDHQSKSLWSQIAMKAITGPMTDTTLTHLFLEHTTWGEWRKNHPTTMVLSTKTGYARNYNYDPYMDYDQVSHLRFPVNNRDKQFPPKEWVVGLEYQGHVKAYPFSELKGTNGQIQDMIDGQPVVIHFSPDAHHAWVSDGKGHPLPSIMSYWFAWYTFHPETEIFRQSQPKP